MLIKINETGSMFHEALEFIKNINGIKTASKAAVEAIIEYQGQKEMINRLETEVIEQREKAYELHCKLEKIKNSLEFLKNV